MSKEHEALEKIANYCQNCDAINSIEQLKELKIDPFVMPYDKSDSYQKDFARWVNHKAVFKTVKWQDYKKTS